MTEWLLDALYAIDEFVDWCVDEDMRLRREAEHNPTLAALLAEADAKYEAKYGRPWVNPRQNDGGAIV